MSKTYDEKNQDEAWQNEVAHDLNQLNALAGRIKSWHCDECESVEATSDDIKSIKSIVRRVAEFENIKRIERFERSRVPHGAMWKEDPNDFGR